jgi:hypothetical protein
MEVEKMLRWSVFTATKITLEHWEIILHIALEVLRFLKA